MPPVGLTFHVLRFRSGKPQPMKRTIRPASRLEGTVTLPGDKSVSHRAVLLNAIADGTAHVSNYASGGDGASMLRCLRGLGVRIRKHSGCAVSGADECLEVVGRGAEGLDEPSGVLNAGNSGTTMRLVSGLLAALPFLTVISGDSSLRGRDMGRIVEPLTTMGATILGRRGNTLAPLAIRGGELQGIDYLLPIASAQVKSAILIAGLFADGRTTVVQPAESRDHTERMLRAMGANVEANGVRVSVGPSKLRTVDVEVPGDVSAAAFWLVAGCCHPNAQVRLRDVGINSTRAGVLEVLNAMGGRVRVENVRETGGEPVADLVAESSELTATRIGGDLIPAVIDELPVLALAACFAKGSTVIEDAAELRGKESDRIETTVEGLSVLGADIEARSDGMVVNGGATLKGGPTRSHGDHRIAMTMAVAGLMASGETTVDEAEAASVTYPAFWDTVEDLANGGQGVG